MSSSSARFLFDIWYTGEFKDAYPEAKVIGMEGLAEKKAQEGLKLDGGVCCTTSNVQELIVLTAYGVDPEGTKYGFEDEIEAWYLRIMHIPYHESYHFFSYFSGHGNKDIAFLHKASKTLITADLLFNLPAKEQVRTDIESSSKAPLRSSLCSTRRSSHPGHYPGPPTLIPMEAYKGISSGA